MKTMKTTLTAIFVTLALAISWVPHAIAAPVNPETDTGSITITLKKSGSGIAGMQVKLWQVGRGKVEDSQLLFELLPQLQAAEVQLNGLNGEQNTVAAAKLLHFCAAQSIVPENAVEKATDSSGKVLFEDMPVGVYLVQSTANASYQAITPYLLQLPAQNGEGTAWDFDVQGAPKVEAQPGNGGGEDPPPDDPQPDNPPPDNPPPDDPRPDNPSPNNPPPDSPSPAPENSVPQLPQTGLVQWPIPVMTVLGLLLMALGFAKKRKDGRG